METRYPLFNKPSSQVEAKPVDPNVHPDDAPRLAGQNAAILERLRRGPATNVELSGLSLKYTGRLSDLRAAGYQIECERGEGGVNTYRLVNQQRGAA